MFQNDLFHFTPLIIVSLLILTQNNGTNISIQCLQIERQILYKITSHVGRDLLDTSKTMENQLAISITRIAQEELEINRRFFLYQMMYFLKYSSKYIYFRFYNNITVIELLDKFGQNIKITCCVGCYFVLSLSFC